MKKRSLLTLVLFAAMGFTSPIHADLLEIRAGVGLNSANPDAFEDRVRSVSNQDLDSDNFENFNADVYFNLPVLPIGVGLRHEWLNNDESAGGNNWEIDANNLSVLVDWRILDNVVYLGPIVGIGYPWANVDFSGGADNINDQINGDQLSYFGGAEAGVKLGRFILGAEVGYSSIKLENTNSQNNNIESKIDLSGFYGKIMAGISLF